MGKLAYLNPEIAQGASPNDSAPSGKSRAQTPSAQGRGRFITPDGRRAPGSRKGTARPTSAPMSRSFWSDKHAGLCATVEQNFTNIPFFALRSVSPSEFSQIFAPGGSTSTALASTFTRKASQVDSFVNDLYRVGQHCFEAGVEESESAGVLLVNLQADVKTRPTWDMEQGKRVDVARLSGIETLPCNGSSSVALARVPLTPDRVLCVIPSDSFRKIGWPDALHPVPQNFIPQALIGKVIELFLKRQQD